MSSLPVNYADLPIASLSTISLEKLLAKDADESSKLFDACRNHGFFYLDLSRVGKIVEDWRELLSFMAEYFAQPIDVKMQDDCKSDVYGYEPCGSQTGVRVGERDCYESLSISMTEINSSEPAFTKVAEENREIFTRVSSKAHDVTIAILGCLSRMLGEEESYFENFHLKDQPSRSTLTLFRYPAQEETDKSLGHNKHTDVGTLTFLLSEQWGLQVLCPDKKCWSFVEPKQNHAIINVGDTLRFLSYNKLSSAVHRVIPLTERQLEHRYSIAYFLRADDNISYKDSNGRTFTAKEWHDKKFDVFRASHEQQEIESYLTGGMEKGGVLISSQ